MTVGVSDSTEFGAGIRFVYSPALSIGSISTGTDFYYPPFSPPPKHHFDPESAITVVDIIVVEDSGGRGLLLTMAKLPETGNVTLWIGHKSYALSSASYDSSLNDYTWSDIDNKDSTDLDWEEDDEVRVALVYERALPSAPTNVNVTAPPGEDGTLAVSWEAPDVGGTFPIEYYLVEFRPVGDARRFVRSHVPVGETSVRRTDLERGVEYRALVQALSGDGYGDPETRTIRTRGRALRAQFVTPPERHDGKKRVKVRAALSEPVDETPQNVGEHGVDVEGGEVTSARKVGGNAPGGAGHPLEYPLGRQPECRTGRPGGRVGVRDRAGLGRRRDGERWTRGVRATSRGRSAPRTGGRCRRGYRRRSRVRRRVRRG